jgi:hypothetical protein
MQAELARQREIMRNSIAINESGSCTGKKCKQEFDAVKGKGTEANSKAPKAEAKKADDSVKDYNGKEIKGGAGAPFNIKPTVSESTTTPLTSRENPDYMDTSHGTEIGKMTGFGKPVENKTPDAVAEENGGEAEKTETPNEVNEDVALHNTDNQNSPKPGTDGEKDEDSAPFEEKVTVAEAVEDLDSDIEDGGEGEDDVDLEGGEGEDLDAPELGEPEGDGTEELEPELGGEDLESRLSNIESQLSTLLDAIDDLKYNDEPLYDDEDADVEGEEDEEDFEGPEAEDDEDFSDDDFDEVVESRSYRRAKRLNEENRLNVFGKHPAYQKKVMTLPQNTNPKRDGQYDMNDDSVESEAPYGQGLGSNAPFEVDPKAAENAIVEEALRILKKKLQ